MKGPFAVAARDYFERTGDRHATIENVVEDATFWAEVEFRDAAGPDGALSLKETAALPPHLADDVLVLRGKLTKGAVASKQVDTVAASLFGERGVFTVHLVDDWRAAFQSALEAAFPDGKPITRTQAAAVQGPFVHAVSHYFAQPWVGDGPAELPWIIGAANHAVGQMFYAAGATTSDSGRPR